MHRALRARRPGTSFLQIFAAWRRYIRFMKAWRSVRRAGRTARRQRIEALVQRASQAAERHDMREIYRVVQQLAPKRRYEPVRIRSSGGEVLTQLQQFEEIYKYFRNAFARADCFDLGPRLEAFAVTPEEVEAAISSLKPRKAVPVQSPAAEVWQTSPKPFAESFVQHLAHCRAQHKPLPVEATDCQLALLPKPGRPSKRPQDLRPLGLQDPCSKILACVLREKLTPYIIPWMDGKPQFAYIPGRSIDEAVLRVCRVCDSIKDLLQRTRTTVHTRRQGQPVPQCTGGALLSLDLSRAFDMLPRWALWKSLRAASVPEDLCRIVLELHEQCHYGIRHNKFQGRFAMQLGVRQGCALSPILFSTFTGFFYEQLCLRTSVEWAEQFITLFEDDTMLQWKVESEQDLRFLEKCVRVTFELFHELGMQVNAAKSRLILVLRGGVAKRWLQRKRMRSGQGYIIRFGSPAHPIDIPHVVSAKHLGIVVSLDNYVQRTCKLRMQLAGGIRQRLLKVWHTSGLGLRTRVLLYASCVRSSMFYGQHAVGFTPNMLRLLDQRDSRYLRAISRSPAHITHESTTALRARLKLLSPADVFQKLLRKRIASCQSQESKEGFRHILDSLEHLAVPASQMGASAALISLEECNPVACDVCGLYFPDLRLLRSHQARKHQYVKTPKPGPKEYVRNSVDGMPQCAHCMKKFTRVEGLKKHLRGSCLQRPMVKPCVEEAAKTSVSCGAVPPERVESLGCTHRASQVAAPSPPLLEQQAFRVQVANNWRSVLQDAKFLDSLSQYCIICGQWVSAMGGIKQHLCLMHPEQWAFKEDASSRCSSLGLVLASPCQYCGLQIKAPRTHMRHCLAVFQSSLAELLVANCQDHGERGSRNGGPREEGGGGDLRHEERLREGHGQVRTGGDSSRPHRGAGGELGSSVQMEQTSCQGQYGPLRQRKLLWTLARREGPVVVRAGSAEPSGAGVLEERCSHAHEARVRDETSSPGHHLDDVCGHGRHRHPLASSAEVSAMAANVSAEASDNQSAGRAHDLCIPGAGHAYPEPHVGLREADSHAHRGLAGRGRDRTESEMGLPAVVSGKVA